MSHIYNQFYDICSQLNVFSCKINLRSMKCVYLKQVVIFTLLNRFTSLILLELVKGPEESGIAFQGKSITGISILEKIYNRTSAVHY